MQQDIQDNEHFISMHHKSDLYLKEGNFDFTSRVINSLPLKAQRFVLLLQQFRAALLKSEVQYDSMSFLELEDILKDSKELPRGVDFYIKQLSHFFDQFGLIDCLELETFERQFIEKIIYINCMRQIEESRAS